MVATSHDDNGNGRITTADRLARIETKLDMVLQLSPRVSELEKGAATREQQIKGVCEDINKLEGKVNAWSWGNSAAAGIAMILGYLGFNR